MFLRVAVGKSGKTFRALCVKKNNSVIFLTFDLYTILRVCNKTPEQLDALSVGDYPVECN